uniref:Putative secreted protein n=1 Tax=Anopheles marajoara TaxID=58244 RepID=A0A2M4CD62_9DIPT
MTIPMIMTMSGGVVGVVLLDRDTCRASMSSLSICRKSSNIAKRVNRCQSNHVKSGAHHAFHYPQPTTTSISSHIV